MEISRKVYEPHTALEIDMYVYLVQVELSYHVLDVNYIALVRIS